MSTRRRHRIITSSDEELEDDIQQLQPPPPPPPPPQQQENDDVHILSPETLNLQNVTLNSSTSIPTIQIDLSDEELIDATEDFFNSPPQPPPNHFTATSSVGMNQASDSPVSRILEDLGLRLRAEWLDSCLRGLETAVPGFSTFDATKKAKLCFEKFLLSDMNCCGAGLLPDNVHQMHLVDLPGPFVLQVDEIVNIGQPLRERYKKANPGLKRCLKLSMTDGVQRVFGMEYQPIKDLEALAPAGLKVAISNVNVRHGLLMLVPEVIQVLGGLVEELDAARQRLVTEVNKPPRGKRTRTGVVPPLATRATRAAWHPNDTNVSPLLNNPVSQGTTPMQVDNQVPVNGRVSSDSAAPNGRVSSTSAVPVNGRESSQSAAPFNGRVSSNSATPLNGSVSSAAFDNNRVSSNSATPLNGSVSSAAFDNNRVSSNFATPVNRRVSSSSAAPVNGSVSSNFATPINGRVSSNFAAPVSGRVSSNSAVPVRRETIIHQPPRTEVESSFTTHRMNTEPLSSTTSTQSSVNMNVDNASFSVPVRRETVETTPFRFREETTVPVNLTPPAAVSGLENVRLADRSSESPFTYLVDLSMKWDASKDKASHVQGKVKCFVTGVKEFQFRTGNTYKLLVYVDDGSLISEILIDHHIVQKKIGYSPTEINTALLSPDPSIVKNMKNIMKQFQVYLVNFEGMMVFRINEAFSVPVAIEMQQGCSLSDAWLLLGRLKSSHGDQRPHVDPIILSP